MVITYSKSMDQPGKVANPVRGQLDRENLCFPVSLLAPDNLVSRDGFGRSDVAESPLIWSRLCCLPPSSIRLSLVLLYFGLGSFVACVLLPFAASRFFFLSYVRYRTLFWVV